MKRSTKLRKSLWLLIVILGMSTQLAHAQTGNLGVNTDKPKTTLDVVGQASNWAGIMAPRVKAADLESNKIYTSEQNGAIVYVNTAKPENATYTGQTEFVNEIGYYYFQWNTPTNGQGRWTRLVKGNPVKDSKVNWFYMPSIAIDASLQAANQEINLYKAYKEQFVGKTAESNFTMATGKFFKSSSAPDEVPYLLQATDFYYYVTDLDNTVIQINSISDSGVLNYDILKAADGCSFINIVFVIK